MLFMTEISLEYEVDGSQPTISSFESRLGRVASGGAAPLLAEAPDEVAPVCPGAFFDPQPATASTASATVSALRMVHPLFGCPERPDGLDPEPRDRLGHIGQRDLVLL